MEELNDRLFRLRKEKGMSQREVGKGVGVSGQTISVWEKGASKPSGDKLKLLSDFFGVSVDYLLSGEPAHLELPSAMGRPTSRDELGTISGEPAHIELPAEINEEETVSLEVDESETHEPETHEQYITKKHKLSFKTILLRAIIVVAVVAAVMLWGVVNDAIMSAFLCIEITVIILLIRCVIRTIFGIAMYYVEKTHGMKNKRKNNQIK